MIGNDIVWLDDPANQNRHRDTRLLLRIFTEQERAGLASATDPHRFLWSLWAAKEAAYKAVCRSDPSLGFSPVRFEVDVGALRVQFGNHCWPVRWDVAPRWVHAVVSDEQDSVVWCVEPRTGSDEHCAVRDLAYRMLSESGNSGGRLVGMPPVYRSPLGDIPVSLSHDGDLVAVAFCRTWTASRHP